MARVYEWFEKVIMKFEETEDVGGSSQEDANEVVTEVITELVETSSSSSYSSATDWLVLSDLGSR